MNKHVHIIVVLSILNADAFDVSVDSCWNDFGFMSLSHTAGNPSWNRMSLVWQKHFLFVSFAFVCGSSLKNWQANTLAISGVE